MSISRRSNCWDNTVIEPFYSRLKVEHIYAGIQRWAMTVLLIMSALAHNQCLLFMDNTNYME